MRRKHKKKEPLQPLSPFEQLFLKELEATYEFIKPFLSAMNMIKRLRRREFSEVPTHKYYHRRDCD